MPSARASLLCCYVPTIGCCIGGTAAAGAAAGLSQPYLPPALLGLDPALEWLCGQHEEALLSCGGDPRCTTADTGFLSSLLLTESDTVSYCHLLAENCWWQGELQGPGCGDLGYLIAAHPSLIGLGAGVVSVLALSCGW